MTSSPLSDSTADAPPSSPVPVQASTAPATIPAQSEGASRSTAMASPSRPPRSSRTMSILALSLGIASIFFAQSTVVPLAAIILGACALRDEPAGRNFSIWGIVLACVAMFGWIFVLLTGALVAVPFFLLFGMF